MNASEIYARYGVQEVKMVDDTPQGLMMDTPNVCADCDIVMELVGIDYLCSMCGNTRIGVGGDLYKNHSETINTNIRITTGANKGRYHNISSDYSRTQLRSLEAQLFQLQSVWTGPAIARDVLIAAAAQYNNIQRTMPNIVYDYVGNVIGQKKFVKRRGVKNEVLGALIYVEGVRRGLIYKKRDIARFMVLETDGFARGEDIVRDLHARGVLDIPVDDEDIPDYVERYMESLKIERPEYKAFVIELVQQSEIVKLLMQSQIISKIAGAIWMLIRCCNLHIDHKKVEKATDNTMKNTFAKFTTGVAQHLSRFEYIFVKWGIPLPTRE